MEGTITAMGKSSSLCRWWSILSFHCSGEPNKDALGINQEHFIIINHADPTLTVEHSFHVFVFKVHVQSIPGTIFAL